MQNHAAVTLWNSYYVENSKSAQNIQDGGCSKQTFCMWYMQQRRTYVDRRNKISVCINKNLEKLKGIFLMILDLINLLATLNLCSQTKQNFSMY